MCWENYCLHLFLFMFICIRNTLFFNFFLKSFIFFKTFLYFAMENFNFRLFSFKQISLPPILAIFFEKKNYAKVLAIYSQSNFILYQDCNLDLESGGTNTVITKVINKL